MWITVEQVQEWGSSAEIMSQEKKPTRSREDAEIERDILAGRKFSLADAIGRLGGGRLLKGDSPVPRKQQAEFEIERYLEQHLIDSAGALEVVLLRRVKHSELFLKVGYEHPFATLALLTQQILSSEQLLRDFVHEVDREWGQMNFERPYLETAGQPPDPEDPYTLSSVRRTLSRLAGELRGD